MEILERIEDQISATGLPLFGITLAAVPCPDTPVILTLHWHAFIKEKLAEAEEAETVSFTPVPSSALQLNDRWQDLVAVDRAAMEAAWELGAWDVARAERPGCLRPGASVQRGARVPAGVRLVSVRRQRQPGGGRRGAGRRRAAAARGRARLPLVGLPAGERRHLGRLRRRCHADRRPDGGLRPARLVRYRRAATASARRSTGSAFPLSEHGQEH